MTNLPQEVLIPDSFEVTPGYLERTGAPLVSVQVWTEAAGPIAFAVVPDEADTLAEALIEGAQAARDA